jgi:hypothetical protein
MIIQLRDDIVRHSSTSCEYSLDVVYILDMMHWHRARYVMLVRLRDDVDDTPDHASTA